MHDGECMMRNDVNGMVLFVSVCSNGAVKVVVVGSRKLNTLFLRHLGGQ